MMTERNAARSSLEYDLISSPMMINGLVQKMLLPSIGSEAMRSPSRENILDSRGLSRTATTILDKSLPAQEIQRYDQVIKLKKSSTSPDFKTTQKDTPRFEELSRQSLSPSVLINQVSMYSGPLHNDRMSSEAQTAASVADKLANARMMQKSGYTWDQAGSCAKIRLGDGAILQNLYPSHSHVKLRCGKVERIDAYYQRMIESDDTLKEITTIKDYEYNQWARTRPINPKDYETSKPIPIDKIESKSVQPSWYTLRPTNSCVTLGAKNRLFSYEDLASKFSSPKFLKRLGFIDSESDYNPRIFTIGDEDEDSKETPANTSQPLAKQEVDTADIVIETDSQLPVPDVVVEEESISESEELSSDDEEYHNDPDPIENLPPERVPSSKRSNRQRLSLYKDDCIIGSKSSQAQVSYKPELEPLPSPRLPSGNNDIEKPIISLSTVKLVDDIINNDKLTNVEPKFKVGAFHTRPMRRDSYKLDFPLKLHRADRKFVRFSQPVCLCPKLSKETLNSFYSPTMQKYLSNHGNAFMKCQLHNPTRNPRIRDKIILKSL